MQSSTANTYLWNIIARSDDYFLIGRSGVANDFYINPSGNATFAGSVTANSFIKSGGTSSQYLMADGSVSTGGTGVDGSGTANDIAMWSDSDTLTDAPIAISGNNAAFAGNIEMAANAVFTQHIKSYSSVRIDIDNDNNQTDRIFVVSKHNAGTELFRVDEAGDLTMQGGRIYLKESDLGNTAIALTRDADEGYVQLFSSGTQTIQKGIEITGGSIAQSTAVLHTNNILYFRGGSNGFFLQNADGTDGYYISNTDHKWEVVVLV